MTTNEAAERLREWMALPKYHVPEWERMLNDALAAERRATVREIRGRLFEAAWRSDGHEWLDPKVVSTILDEEAAR